MSEVTKLCVGRPFGLVEHPLYIDLLKTREAKQQALCLIWKQVQVNTIFSALVNLLNEEPEDAQILIMGCFSLFTNELIAVDVLHRRQFSDSPLQQDELKGEAYGNFINYRNIIHKHVQANFQAIDRNNYYLTSLGLFTMPAYNSLDIQRELIHIRKLVARDLRIEVIASPFIGRKIQDIAESFKYIYLYAFNRAEILQLGMEEFPIKLMASIITFNPETNSQISHQTRTNIVPQILPRIPPQSRLISYQTRNDAGAFKVHYTNIRGLKSNFNAVYHLLETEKPHLLFLMETQIEKGHFNCPGYSLEHNFKRYAGVCVYIRKDLCYQRLCCYEVEKIFTLWLLVNTGSHKTIYVGVYRSHSKDPTTELFGHLTEKAELAKHEYPSVELVFLGDFNAHHKEWLSYQIINDAGGKAYEFAKSLRLHQKVLGLPTRIPDVPGHKLSCLDLLLTTHPDRHIISVWAPLGSSDHCLVKSESPCAHPG